MIKYLKEIVTYKELLFTITMREIMVRYKQSVLGILWAVLKPLSMMVIFTIIFSRFAKIPSDGIPYPIFTYSALLPWTFFSTSLSFAIPSLVSNTSIVTKMYFPREIFPIASVMAAVVDFLIAGVIFILMMCLYRIPVNLNAFFIISIFLIQVILTLGIAFFASAINVYYRDVKYAMSLVIQLWMYACPIIYPVSIVPDNFKFFYMLNPMAPIIDGYRKVLVQGQPPDFYYLGIAAGISVAFFFLSYWYFKRVEMTFADVI